MLRRAGSERGVSLIEALVALAVMAFGMLGIVGVQATLRLNSDIAKQRSEAVRIGQEAIEQWRAFTRMDTATGVTAYADVDNVDPVAVTGYTTNTTYTLEREVQTSADPRLKSLRVTVRWADRTAADSVANQSVELNTSISGITPDVAGTLSLAANGSPTKRVQGRSTAVPVAAKLFDNGTSGFMPPQASGGTAAWLFDNVTGLVKLCQTSAATTTALTRENITSCSEDVYQLLSGYVRFAYNVPTPTAATSESPPDLAFNLDVSLVLTSTGHPGTPPATCLDDSPISITPTITSRAVAYYCLIGANTGRTWSGTSTLVPLGLDANPAWVIASSGTGAYKVCRYTPSSGTITNPRHPAVYSGVTKNDVMSNQNFLVIAAASTCPTDVAADPANGDFVDSHTAQHQP